MKRLTEKFVKLKTAVGGNRETYGYEDTIGVPKEEQANITGPSRANVRILSELEFALKLSQAERGRYDPELEAALDGLLSCIGEEGVLTDRACGKAEEILSPLERPAKEYSLILAAHAHMDMNWMWGYHETVAVVLATFRSILGIMEQYPQFRFSQSQASVYRIVEEQDPELMERIKRRIAEGRWEVTATSWVETDQNMPNTESLLRQIQYAREYLASVWGAEHFDVDFSPDTFGHGVHMPEIDRFGGVKYLYHCRGLGGETVLYRYRAPSGRELLAYREPYWYNGFVTPRMAAGIVELSRRCAGLKTGLIVYGVGDHGGGPTRRDVERALEMMSWKIYPKIRFGTFREFFLEAESVRDQLPVVEHELNFFAPGCYTTQSRIKRGNRRLEAKLRDTESLTALAGEAAGFSPAPGPLRRAWQNVLFTHFHDILTGSCVQDSREYAMSLYQTAAATADTRAQNAMRAIGEQIDTSSVPADADSYHTRSAGAGAGYGTEDFAGVPSPERGSGKTRVFHIFNTLPVRRSEVVPLTVWDWPGDLRCVRVEDCRHNPVETQLLDASQQQYWDHRYFRILVDVTVPALGYTTLVLTQDTPESDPTYFRDFDRLSDFYDDPVLQNDRIRVAFDAETGRIRSLRGAADGRELLAGGETAGLSYIETEAATSNAWNIGRSVREIPVDRCVKLEKIASGPLRESVRATYLVAGSSVEATHTLDRHAAALRTDLRIDWREIGKETVPVLTYRVPTAYAADSYLYDVPGGAIRRKPLNNDVPALQYGLAESGSGEGLIVVSDSKYGFRGTGKALSLTLLNSSTAPDPYPEVGVHTVAVWTGFAAENEKAAEDMADALNHPLIYQSSFPHAGKLPMENGLLAFDSDHAVLSAVLRGGDGGLAVRFYEVGGAKGKVSLKFGKPVARAEAVDLFGQPTGSRVAVRDCAVECTAEPYSICELKIRFR